MLIMATAALLALSTVVPAHGAAGADYAGPPISVSVVTADGSGCRSVIVTVAEDHESFTTTFGDYIAKVGGGTGRVVDRASCRLELRIVPPKSFTYGIARATYNGYLHLARGATAAHKANLAFQGQIGIVNVERKFSGPQSDEWEVEHTATPGGIVYVPCGELRNLTINAELRANLGSSDPAEWSMISGDSVDAPAHAEYRLAFKPCR
ncbi:DUF4360 domain-containing protein [Actinosynnema sp. CS-041913]|uniref:DUF4360 domain-containing protein n=1 Tax=Actinosynnema sp. CS-041913 TaxID=3239917 RepID=UPI003D91078D